MSHDIPFPEAVLIELTGDMHVCAPRQPVWYSKVAISSESRTPGGKCNGKKQRCIHTAELSLVHVPSLQNGIQSD